MVYSIYVGGEFVETNEKIKVYNPYTSALVADCSCAGIEHVDKAIIAAQNIREELSNLSGLQKSIVLNQISNGLLRHKEELANILASETAKPLFYARNEVERAAYTFSFAAIETQQLKGEYFSLDQTPNGKNKQGLVKYFPVGVVAGIAPFNFPLNLVAHKIAPAIATGCPIVLKPSSTAPLSALALANIIAETDLPKGAVSIVPCSRETGNMLIQDERINCLSFTGSPVVGWEMKKEAGKKRVLLELGGNAAAFINEDVDVAGIVQKCVTGAFAYAGQICIHTQRFYIHEKVYDLFVQLFIQAIKELNIGDPLNEATRFSVMIDEKNALRVEGWLNEAVAGGAKVLHGGKRTANYMEPTVVTNTNTTMKINAEENFGPVVCVEKVKTEKEAFAAINQSRFGLQASVFTNSIACMQNAFKQLEVGCVLCNEITTFRVDNMPYGGIKDSGMGREGVAYAMREFMEPKLLVF